MTSRAEERKVLIHEVKAALSAKVLAADAAITLCAKLKAIDEFGYAWRLLELARDLGEPGDKWDLKFRQEIALCTYKDTHLNEEYRLVKGLKILDKGNHLETSDDPETLGLAGAIHKRLWRIRKDQRELETSLLYYYRGHEADRDRDYIKEGYPGINAAFILDKLASLDREADGKFPALETSIAMRSDQAADIRKQIIAGLQPKLAAKDSPYEKYDYWAIVTMAEACFGLGEFPRAKEWLQIAQKIEVPDWEFETAARQLTDLAKLLAFDGTDTAADFEDSEAGRVLLSFLGDSSTGLKSVYVGKVGLSLSGGGFRASLFHIGVLARLAELDQLRHIEVISCVSGGSIIGAHYCLELRNLLRDVLDKDIEKKDYIELVKRVQKGFLKGVQTNIRMQIAAEWTTNLKMIFSRGYSRTQRLGELYEEKLYSAIVDDNERKPQYMSDLMVLPKDSKERGEKSFSPRRQNWRRANKVPILILNATTLNTGHNWQFTASWMGESPATVNPDIDVNYRLRRLYYDDVAGEFPRVRLGTAVGASSCVPGLFEPVALKGLYEHPGDNGSGEEITVKLVDGGVHDNQGVVGLIEQDCAVMLVSDASGQMEADDNPSNGLLAVPLRTNSILMNRVRDAEYVDLMSRMRSGELRELMFIHLKMDLRADPVNWVNCSEPSQPSEAAAGEETDYGMNRRVQHLLAANRTDLDAWSDAEAYTLMLSGYRMTEHQMDPETSTLPVPSGSIGDHQWDFMETDELQRAAKEGSMFMRILKVGSLTPLKVWYLCKPLTVLGLIIALIALLALARFGYQHQDVALITVRDIGIFMLTLLVATFFGKVVMQTVWFRQTLGKFAFGVVMSMFGFIVARLHLHVFNPLYLRLGKLDRLRGSK
jgi:predicted acylesterase/phospholipase RssA